MKYMAQVERYQISVITYIMGGKNIPGPLCPPHGLTGNRILPPRWQILGLSSEYLYGVKSL